MQVFLSHDSEESAIAQIIRNTIEECALGEAKVWFSSDTSPHGGMSPGGPWFDQLLDRVSEANVFLALLTPRSVDNLWINYEAGCAATKRVPVVPVLAGLSATEVRLPLALYNAYNVAQPEGLKTLLIRLFEQYNIKHRPMLLETPSQIASREIARLVADASDSTSSTSQQTDLDKVLRLVDRRFIDLIAAIPNSNKKPAAPPVYSVPFEILITSKVIGSFSIDVEGQMTVQDVFDQCYFILDEKLNGKIEANRYLVDWVLRDSKTSKNLIMRDVTEIISASAVFKPGHVYQVLLLASPYDPKRGRNQYFKTV